MKPHLDSREQAILCGLFLSRCDVAGLERLGFSTFKEAYNILGLALDVKPASIKNYRDELDPLFPNSRRGWHGRPLRTHCEKIYHQFRDVDVEQIISLIARFSNCNFDNSAAGATQPDDAPHSKRMLTGKAAENYFLQHYQKRPEFQDHLAADVTSSGCGYDFQLCPPDTKTFLAVEVKGLSGKGGSISLTDKEYATAHQLSVTYFLYVVTNFDETPTAAVMKNPLNSDLVFRRREAMVAQVSWQTSI